MMKVVLISTMLVVSTSAFFGMPNQPGGQAPPPTNNQVGNTPPGGVDMNRVMQMAQQMLVVLLPKLLANPSLMSAFMAGNAPPAKSAPFDPNSIPPPVLTAPGNRGPPSGPSGPSGPGPVGPTGPTDPFGRQQGPSGPIGRPNRPSGPMGRPNPSRPIGRPSPSGQFGPPSFRRPGRRPGLPSKPMPPMTGAPGRMPGMPGMAGMSGGMMPAAKPANPFAGHVTNPYAPRPRAPMPAPAMGHGGHHHMMYGMGDAYKDVRLIQLLRDPDVKLITDPMIAPQLPPANVDPLFVNFSFPDSLKEQIQFTLMRRQATAPLSVKEQTLFHLIGDPPSRKDMMRMGLTPTMGRFQG